MRYFLIFGLLAVGLAGCVSSHEPLTMAIVNGRIWTGVPGQEWAEAVGVTGDRIVAVGDSSEIRAGTGPDTRIIDAGGRFLMPGFIDNHSHFVPGGFQLLGLNLRDAVDEQELAARIRDYAVRLPAGRWILGGDWDHESWPSGQIPHRSLIDAHTRENPVLVNRLDGHMALANQLALQMAGITLETPDPPGGLIVRDRDGEPTGMLKDTAMDLVRRVIPAPSDEEAETAALEAFQRAAQLGVTSVNAMVSRQEARVLNRLSREGKASARIYAIPSIEDQDFWVDERPTLQENEFFRLRGLKGFVDGSLGSTTAWFHEPYTDAPETSGLPAGMWFPKGNLEKLARSAVHNNFQLVIHAIGDRANDELLDIFEKAGDTGQVQRPRVEHSQHLTRPAIQRYAELGVIASVQPYHAIDDGRWAEERIGLERIQTTYAFRSLLDAGVVVTFGSDWTVAPMNPLLGVFAAVTRRTLDGRNPEGWVPAERIGVEEALRCYTVNNAYAMFQEGELGTVEPGKWADLVMLSDNPLEVDPATLGELRVLLTVVGGVERYSSLE